MQRIRSHLHLFDIFEVAARHGSFKSAADELNLTPSAVSHQIKTLEAQLETNLFDRKPGKVSLNREGKCLLEKLQPAFSQFDDLKSQLNGYHVSRIMVFPHFPEQALQLLQALPKSLNLTNTIKVDPILNLQQLKSESFDFALRIGNGNWPEFETVALSHANTMVVAHKDFVAKHPLKDVSELKKLKFLYCDTHQRILELFPQAVNLERDYPCHQYYEEYTDLFAALMAGEGYSDLYTLVIKPHLESGELVSLFSLERHWREKIYLIYHKDREISELDQQIIKTFQQLFSPDE